MKFALAHIREQDNKDAAFPLDFKVNTILHYLNCFDGKDHDNSFDRRHLIGEMEQTDVIRTQTKCKIYRTRSKISSDILKIRFRHNLISFHKISTFLQMQDGKKFKKFRNKN